MRHNFRKETNRSEIFFNILPKDWQDSIVPFWDNYSTTSQIFVIEINNIVVGGGIVFSSVSPDTIAFREEALRWFGNGYLYIGFFYIAEKYRDKKLGSEWLKNLSLAMPHQKFWLSIDELKLSSFYMRNGFNLIKKIKGEFGDEWIMAQ